MAGPLGWITARLSGGFSSTEFLLVLGVLGFCSSLVESGKMDAGDFSLSAAIAAGAYCIGRGLTKFGKGSVKPSEDKATRNK